MVEAYQPTGTYDSIGQLVKELVQKTAMDVYGSHKVTLLDGTEYDFGGEWKTISMYDSLSESLGEEIVPNGGPDAPGTSVEHLGAIADKLGVERDDVENHGKLVEHLWEHFYEDKLYEPPSCVTSRSKPPRWSRATAPSPAWWRSGISTCAASSWLPATPSSTTRSCSVSVSWPRPRTHSPATKSLRHR